MLCVVSLPRGGEVGVLHQVGEDRTEIQIIINSVYVLCVDGH